MSSVAHSPPERGQLVSHRSRQWVVSDVRASTLPPPALKPAFSGPQHLLTLASVDDRRLVGVSFSKPQCMVLPGYMGSGKSYALGVLVENTLLTIPNLSSHRQPLSVIAFNFRRNPDARFEYWGFMQPNSKPAEVARLRSGFQGEPASIRRVRRVTVFAMGRNSNAEKTSTGAFPPSRSCSAPTNSGPSIGKS